MKSFKFKTSILFLMTFNFISLAFSATIHVPKDVPTIQMAIDAAVNGDTVLVAPGTYVENINYNYKAICIKSLNGPSVTVIDGSQSEAVVTIIGDSDTVLDGFTITNGKRKHGPGIRCLSSNAKIVNNVVTGNLIDPDISGGAGGGIYCASNSAHIENNTITGNGMASATKYIGGGGIYCTSHLVTIKNNTITGNYGSCGGGVYIGPLTSGAITSNTIAGNFAYFGGGVYCNSAETPTFSNNVIIGNQAGLNGVSVGFGGGVYIDYSSPALSNNLIIGNRALSASSDNGCGGGIFCDNSSVTLTSNTISRNTASSYGGGFSCLECSDPSITNTIFWDNIAPEGPEIWVWDSSLSISYSDVKGGQSMVHVEPGSTLNWGAGMMDKDPLFISGPKGFYYLSHLATGHPTNSPCVDAGSNLASSLGMDAFWTRRDGVADSGMVDIGYHYGPFIYPSLQADTYKIPENLGGSAAFLLLGEKANAHKNYLVFGSVSGSFPGVSLPGNHATLPINWDIFTNIVLSHVNQPVFQKFMGVLDSSGTGYAVLNAPPAPGAAGITMSFAYGLVDGFGTWDFASNPITVKIVP